MTRQDLPAWTLAVHLDGEVLRFSLGDGRRHAWHASQPASVLRCDGPAPRAAALLGDALTARLKDSAERSLCILYDDRSDERLDALPWEQLSIGNRTLGQHFQLSRQLVSDSDPTARGEPVLADALSICVLQRVAAPTSLSATCLRWDEVRLLRGHEAIASAHVLAFDEVPLAAWQQLFGGLSGPHLLVVTARTPPRVVAAALDAGAAVLWLEPPATLEGGAMHELLSLLDRGHTIGEAVRALHMRAMGGRPSVRLYGDPTLRFVRPPAETLRRQVTSLSFDIVGSTAMMATRGDEAYADLLSELHARCTAIVRRHGGTPDDPQGDDGVMCYFGHPVAMEGAAVRAVEAGLAMVRTVAELGIDVRVGIATGEVAVRAGQPVGLSIHLAARLQRIAVPGTVVLSEPTRHLVEQRFDLEPLASVPELKGIGTQEALYRVLGASAEVRTQRTGPRSVPTPLVGRHAELERLRSCWSMASAGNTRVVVIRGEAGMGKSRLVREFRLELEKARTKVLECRCRVEAKASPFLALAEALRRALDIGPEDSYETALAQLEAVLPATARAQDGLALLASLLGMSPPTRAGTGGQRRQLVSLLLDWFDSFSEGKTCCLIVEDWHWVDPSMRDFVEQLAAYRGASSLLIVVTVRSEVTGPTLPGPHDRIELTGLAPADARALVDAVCARSPLPSPLSALLARRGDGVPLFLEEAARMALDLGGRTASADTRALADVPASLQDLLTARLDALGPAKNIAQVAAVIGRQFSHALLAALLEMSGRTSDGAMLDERLAALVASNLIRLEDPGVYSFRHALIRDAAYASLWSRDRRQLHARIVHLLQQRWRTVAEAQPELLALHQSEAGMEAEAMAAWELAARRATARSAEHEAISHLRSALAALTRQAPGVATDRTALRLQLLLAARLLATEGYGADAVLSTYREAQRLCDRIGDAGTRFKIEMGLQAYRFMRADFGLAFEHGRRALDMAADSGDVRQTLQAQWGQACTLFHQGQLRASMRVMDASLAVYTPAMHAQFGIQDPGVMCMAYSSWGLWEGGRPDAALARAEAACAMAERFGHRFSQAVAQSYTVSVRLLRGDTSPALALAETCAQLCEEHGFPVWHAITRCMRGHLWCQQGDFLRGLPEMEAGHAQWLATGARVSQPLYLSLQAEGLILAGDLRTAQLRVMEGLEIIDRFGERQLQAELMRLRGELAMCDGDAAQGEAWLKRAYVLALRQHRLGFALRSATALARLWLANRREHRARRLLAPLVRRWREGLATRDVQVARALLAQCGDTMEEHHAREQEAPLAGFSRRV